MNGKQRILALALLTTTCASAQPSFDPNYAAGEAAPLPGAGPHSFVYYEKGEGNPIVFFTPVADQRWWQLQIEPFAERYRAVVLGGGPRASGTPGDYIAALETVREKLGVQRLTLVAHSISAWMAMQLAIVRPGLFNALVLEEAAWAPDAGQGAALAGAQCALEDLDPVALQICLFLSMQMGPGRFESMPEAMRRYFFDVLGRSHKKRPRY